MELNKLSKFPPLQEIKPTAYAGLLGRRGCWGHFSTGHICAFMIITPRRNTKCPIENLHNIKIIINKPFSLMLDVITPAPGGGTKS